MTDKTPAMPELVQQAIGFYSHSPDGQYDEIAVEALSHHLAALQSAQPAEVSDAEIRDALEAEFLNEPGKRNLADDLRIARAILALRPQAVPMTRAQRLEVFRKAEDRMAHDINLCWRNALIEETEAHHGITQRADGGEV